METFPSIEEKFNKLAKKWKDDTRYQSNMRIITEDPSYQEIIKIGKDVIPIILKELESRPDHWFVALQIITGENPVIEEDCGYFNKMVEAWLNWGKEHGIAE
jgi:hypothetical protein